MTDAEAVLARVAACGYRVAVGADGPSLHKTRPDARLTPKVLDDLKAHRAAVVSLVAAMAEMDAGHCDACSATWHARPTPDDVAAGCNLTAMACPYKRGKA